MPAVPYYRQIIDDIKGQIASGELAPGDAIMSTRQLAARYEVAPSTVRSAISILLETGVLTSRQGVGVFVAEPQP